MSNLMIGLLSALAATNQLAALSNLVTQTTGIVVAAPGSKDPVSRELDKLMADDDAAHEEVDQWIIESKRKEGPAREQAEVTLRARVQQRLGLVQKAYENFLRKHPEHAGARLAYGSFLSGIQEETDAAVQWEKARELDPENAAAWNNLANHYGHRGPVRKAFEYYLKAIELDPSEPVYHENFATTVYLFRRDATNFFNITEREVFEKALGLYRKALDLDPGNFLLATHYAESYYGIRPPVTGDAEADRKAAAKLNQDALEAWQKALGLARDEIEREGVQIHLARIHINGGRFGEAREILNAVTNGLYDGIKRNLSRKISSRENPAPAGTRAPDPARE